MQSQHISREKATPAPAGLREPIVNAPAPQSGVHARAAIDAEIIRLRLAGLSYPRIADATGISRSALDYRLRILRHQGCAAVAPEWTGENPREWPAERKRRLAVLWGVGHSTRVIGEMLGVTKNAVVGQANRQGLPMRPSPIRRSGEAPSEHRRPGRPPRVPADAATLPPLASLAGTETGAGGAERTPPFRTAPSAPASGSGHPSPARPPQAAPAPPPPPRYGRVVECAWPLDHPTRPGRFLACDAPTVPGRPYCPVHAEQAYVLVRDRRGDVAA